MLTPDESFMRAANAAAAALRSQPAYVSYRETVHAAEGTHRIDETVRVVVRTDDGRASLAFSDGSTFVDPAPPGVPPTFDFLADFFFTYDFTGVHAKLTVDYNRPRTFTTTVKGANANVVVASVRGYAVEEAPSPSPETVKLALRRLDGLAARRDPIQTFLGFTNVEYSAASGLPTHVVFAGLNDTMTADYAATNGVNVLTHFAFSATTYDSHKHALVATYDATYDDVRFSETPPA
jgi:hypothetical protein